MEAPLNDFTVRGGDAWYTHLLFSDCFNKQKSRDSSLYNSEAFITLAPFVLQSIQLLQETYDCCHVRSISRLSVRKALCQVKYIS